MMNYIITTLPIKCNCDIKILVSTSAAYSSAIASKVGCKPTLYLNKLNSFVNQNANLDVVKNQLLLFCIYIVCLDGLTCNYMHSKTILIFEAFIKVE